MIKKILVGLFISLSVLMIALVLTPVPSVTEGEALVVKGIVSSVYEGGTKDIVFRLEGNDCKYYINRGLEQGLIIAELKEKLLGKEATFKYPKHWTPLDWDNKSNHISKVEVNGEVLFNSLRK